MNGLGSCLRHRLLEAVAPAAAPNREHRIECFFAASKGTRIYAECRCSAANIPRTVDSGKTRWGSSGMVPSNITMSWEFCGDTRLDRARLQKQARALGFQLVAAS